MSFVLAVCGGRDYSDSARVFQSLDRVHAKRRITILVHGPFKPMAGITFSQGMASDLKQFIEFINFL